MYIFVLTITALRITIRNYCQYSVVRKTTSYHVLHYVKMFGQDYIKVVNAMPSGITSIYSCFLVIRLKLAQTTGTYPIVVLTQLLRPKISKHIFLSNNVLAATQKKQKLHAYNLLCKCFLI